MVFPRRLQRLLLLTALAFGLVWLRVGWLQVLEGATWAEEAWRKRTRVVVREAPRGRIVDRDGRVLAHDQAVFQLALLPWEWMRRARARCTACGWVHTHLVGGPAPRACRCREPGSRLEPEPPGDLGPIEEVLALPRGELARRASDRIAYVEHLVRGMRARLAEDEEVSDFLVHDKLRLFEADMLHRPFVLVGRIPVEAVRLVETDEEARYHGLVLRTDLRREYPEAGLAPQLLGYTSVVRDRAELERERLVHGPNVTLDTRLGRAGLERAYDGLLLGRLGRDREVRDERGSFALHEELQAPERGKELRLALTVAACRKAEEILDGWGTREAYHPGARPSGALVVLRAEDGAVLAWGELPRYDLAEDLRRLFDPAAQEAGFDADTGQWLPTEAHGLPKGESLEAWRDRLAKPAPAHLSRVFQVAVEPGSTLKTLVALTMLEADAPLPSSPFSCGSWHTSPGCHPHGPVLLIEALGYSCNRYFALTIRDGPGWPTYRRALPEMLVRTGLGRTTGLDVHGEAAGILLRDWVDFEPAQAIQAAAAAARAALAHRGVDVHVDVRPGVPDVVAGRGAERLHAALEEGLVRMGEALGGPGRVGLCVTRLPGDGRDVPLRFDLVATPPAAADAPPSAFVAHGPSRPDLGALDARLRGMGARMEPAAEDDRFALGFTLSYERALGRLPGQAPVLRPDDGRNVAIGQGPITVTPIQLARAMAALANGGRLVTPHVVEEAGGRCVPAPASDLGLSPESLRVVRAGMAMALGPGGTAQGAPWHTVAARVYGKTGTSEVGPWWTPGGAPEKGPWHHWFVGFAEAPGRPAIAFALVLHARTERAAGLTAVPAAHAFLAWWFREGPGAR